MRFWLPWTVDAIVAIVAVYFFLVGIADGSVSDFNVALWLGLLLLLGGILGGSLWLRAHGHAGAAQGLAWLLAVPALGALALLLIVLVTNPRWN